METLVTTTCPKPLDVVATELGVRVRTAPVPSGLWGVYDHRHNLITLKPGLGAPQRRSTLAHELGHAHYGHQYTTPKHERAADVWAARTLLDPRQVAEQARFTGDIRELAAELEVLPWVIRVFVETLSKPEVEGMLAVLRDGN